MYLDPALSTNDRWHVTRMMYGSQTDAFDYHKVGSHLTVPAAYCELIPTNHVTGGFRCRNIGHIPGKGWFLQDREGGLFQYAISRHL